MRKALDIVAGDAAGRFGQQKGSKILADECIKAYLSCIRVKAMPSDVLFTFVPETITLLLTFVSQRHDSHMRTNAFFPLGRLQHDLPQGN